MSFASMLPERCRILVRATDTTGKNHTASYTAQAEDVVCRSLIRMASSYDSKTAQSATVVRVRFALPNTAVVRIRDRIRFNARVYEVIQVNAPFGMRNGHHQVAICEAVAGSV